MYKKIMPFRIFYIFTITILFTACQWNIKYLKCEMPNFENIPKQDDRLYSQGEIDLDSKSKQANRLQENILKAKINAAKNLLPNTTEKNITQNIHKFKQERIIINKCDQVFIYISIDKKDLEDILKPNLKQKK